MGAPINSGTKRRIQTAVPWARIVGVAAMATLIFGAVVVLLTYHFDLDGLYAGSQVWYAAGTWVVAVASSMTLYSIGVSYNRSKRTESARLVKDIYEKWFFDPVLQDFRQLIEDGARWRGAAVPALKYGLDPTADAAKTPLTAGERSTLATIDVGLNYLEFIVQMKTDDAIVDRHLESFLCYWVDSLMRLENRTELRRYIFAWGWFSLQDRLMTAPAKSFFPRIVVISRKSLDGDDAPTMSDAYRPHGWRVARHRRHPRTATLARAGQLNAPGGSQNNYIATTVDTMDWLSGNLEEETHHEISKAPPSTVPDQQPHRAFKKAAAVAVTTITAVGAVRRLCRILRTARTRCDARDSSTAHLDR